MAVGDSLPFPAKGWKRYGAFSGLISYFGTWTREASTAYILGARAASPRSVLNSGYSFKFKGTKLRLLAGIYPEYTPQFTVAIDGVVYNASQQGPSKANAVIFEIENLPNTMHSVVVTKVLSGTWTVDMILEAIDVGAEGRAFHVNEVESPLDLEVGKKIRAYSTSGIPDTPFIKGLGQETMDFIDPYYATNNYRNGDFYFNMVDGKNGSKVLIADRNLAMNIIGSDLVNSGLTSGLPVNLGDLRGIMPTMYTEEDSRGFVVKGSPNTYGTDYGWKVFAPPNIDTRPFWYSNGSGDKYIDIALPEEKVVVALSIGASTITGSSSGVKGYRLVGIDATGKEVHLLATTKTNTVGIKIDQFENAIPFKRYRLYVDSSHYNTTTALVACMQLYEVNQDNILNGQVLTVPSGSPRAVEPTLDGMSEWDMYMVNSKHFTDPVRDWSVISGVTGWTWTRTVYTGGNNLTVRGGGSIAGISYAPASPSYALRPLLRLAPLVQYPAISLDRDYYLVARGNGADMKVTVLPSQKYPDIKWGVRVKVGNTQVYWSGELVGAAQLTVSIPPRLFTTSEEMPVYVELVADGKVRVKAQARAQIVNNTPEIRLEREGYKLMLDIVDTDGDPIYYEFKINGVDLVPPGNAMGQIRMDYYLQADQINIGLMNKITVKAIDLYGDEKDTELEFMGEYIGLVFSNENGDIYSTDSGEILRRLVMPFVRAGENTVAVPVVVTNKYPFNVRDLTLSVGYYEDLPDTGILLGKDPSNVNYTALTYDDMMSNGQFKTFYVMLHTEETAVGRGKFRIQANARKV